MADTKASIKVKVGTYETYDHEDDLTGITIERKGAEIEITFKGVNVTDTAFIAVETARFIAKTALTVLDKIKQGDESFYLTEESDGTATLSIQAGPILYFCKLDDSPILGVFFLGCSEEEFSKFALALKALSI